MLLLAVPLLPARNPHRDTFQPEEEDLTSGWVDEGPELYLEVESRDISLPLADGEGTTRPKIIPTSAHSFHSFYIEQCCG